MNQVALSMGMALLLSVLTYMTKLQKGEAFDALKAVRTLVIGLIIGSAAWHQNIQLTADNWDTYMTANVGVIALLDQGLKLIGRLIKTL